MSLFCPQGHLLLQQDAQGLRISAQCPQCGWRAPVGVQPGQKIWQVHLRAPLIPLGFSRYLYAHPALHNERLILPLANGELVALRTSDGRILWRTAVGPAHLRLHVLQRWKQRLLGLVMDERPLGTEHAIAEIDPDSGQWHPIFTRHEMFIGLEPVEEGVITRTSTAVWHLTPRGDDWQVRWQKPVAYVPARPQVMAQAHQILVLNQSQDGTTPTCLALNATTGQALWEIPLPPPLRPAVSALRAVAIPHGVVWSGLRARGIWALDTASGATRWLWEGRVYSTPAFDGEHIWAVVRGNAPRGEEGYYLLVGLAPQTGEIVTRHPLPRRVVLPPLVLGNTVIVFDEHGHILAISPHQGTIAWEIAVGTEDDPPGMPLILGPQSLIAGTSHGNVAALKVHSGAHEHMAPQILLDAQEFEAAATAFALQGNLSQAARILAEKLQQPAKAIAILEFGNLMHEAINIAWQYGLYDEVERLAEKAGEIALQARAREQRGDLLGAARLWEKFGETTHDQEALEKAAALYEQRGAEDEAWRLRKALGQVSVLERLRRILPSWEDLERYAQEKGLEAAAQLALQRGLYDRAAEFFRRLAEEAEKQGDQATVQVAWAQERRALQQYIDQALPSEEVTWAWERMAHLARRLGDFLSEAQAWEHAGEADRAADAYFRAARQAEQQLQQRPFASRGENEKVAFLYEQFLRLHGIENEALMRLWEGGDARLETARERILALRKLPWVVIEEVRQDKTFRENQFSRLSITMSNKGYGRATDIQLYISEDGRFEVVPASDPQQKYLFPRSGRLVFHFLVRPKPDQTGDAVPLQIRWSWRDDKAHKEILYENKRSFPVKVLPQSHAETGSSRPTIIHAETVVMGDEARVYSNAPHVEGGGSYVQGDQLAPGAQKGDRVVLGGGTAGVQMTDTAMAPYRDPTSRTCPICHLPVPHDVIVCPACGNPLPEPTN